MDDKDVIIAQLQKENSELRALVAELRDKIARLEKNSSNSSKPNCPGMFEKQVSSPQR
jgi:cell division protein FtsB